MSKEEDEKLERIKRRKIEEMMKNVSDGAEEENQPMKSLGKPLDLTDAMFNKFVEDNFLSVIDCWAPWCGPCHIVSPRAPSTYRSRFTRETVGGESNKK